jgi:hypothetical protein
MAARIISKEIIKQKSSVKTLDFLFLLAGFYRNLTPAFFLFVAAIVA